MAQLYATWHRIGIEFIELSQNKRDRPKQKRSISEIVRSHGGSTEPTPRPGRAQCRRRANATSCSRCRSSADFVANSTRTRTATSPPRRLRFQAGVLRFQAGTLREQKGTALRQCSTQHASHANRVFLSYIHATRDRSHIVRMTYCNLRTNIVHTCEPLNCEPLNRSRLPRDAAAAFEHPT